MNAILSPMFPVSSRRTYLLCAAVLLISAGSVGGGESGKLKPKYFKARVISSTHIAVAANTIPIPMRLAGISHESLKGTSEHDKFAARAMKYLQDDLKRAGGKVRIAVSKGYDYKLGGTPVVYAYIVHSKHEILLNKRPIHKGYAGFDKEDVTKDTEEAELLLSAERTAKKLQLGIWQPEVVKAISAARAREKAPVVTTPAPVKPPPAVPSTSVKQVSTEKSITVKPGLFYAEKGKTVYYPGSNAWAKRINPKRLLEFADETAAQAAGYRPHRSRASRSSDSKKKAPPAGVGKLVGLKSDDLIHTHLCPVIKNRPDTEKEFFGALAEAQGKKRTLCTSCMRLGNRNWPQPEPGECIGRAPPYFRPCLRPGEKKTRICKRCAGTPGAE